MRLTGAPRWLRATLVGGGLVAAGWGALLPTPGRFTLGVAGIALVLLGVAWPRRVGRPLATVAGAVSDRLHSPNTPRPTGSGVLGAPEPASGTDTDLLDALPDGVAVLDAEGADRVHAQAAIAAHTRELESANDHLRRVNRELAEAAGFKSDLIDMVSHELSQPLSSVVSLSELLVSDWETLPDEIRQDLATKIERNTGRLATMLADLMLLFRLDAGLVTARRAPVAIQPVVEAVLERLPKPIGVVTFIEPELTALVDREHLRLVLVGLVTNAVEFGAPPVEIHGRHRPDGVVLTVRDHGSGVAEDLVPELFARFTRARAIGSSGRKGAGLGLYIAGHLVRLNEGAIWYEPVSPHGAALHVRLTPSP